MEYGLLIFIRIEIELNRIELCLKSLECIV